MAEDDSKYVEKLEQEVARLQSQNKHHWRQFFAYTFLVLGMAAVIPASTLIWANRTITNPSNYIAVAGPLIDQPSIQKAITQAADRAVFKNVDVDQAVSRALPDNAQFLAAPISTQVENYAKKAVAGVVASDQFKTVWVRVNQKAQQSFMKAANSGRDSPTINLNDIYAAISKNLSGTKLAPLANHQLPPKVGEVKVVTIPALAQITHYVALLSDLRWLFLGLAAGLMFLALVTSAYRRRMAISIGIAWIAAALLTVVLVRAFRSALIDQVNDPVYKEALLTAWKALLHPLAVQTAVLSVAGLAAVVAGWLSGPSRWAVTSRTFTEHQLGGWRHQLWPSAEKSSAIGFTRKHHMQFLGGLLALTVALILVLAPFTVWTFVALLGSILLLLLALEFLVAAPAV
jgi:hypothetical protein